MERERWRLMEQFEQIARCPTWSGDLISKADTWHLRRAGLIRWNERARIGSGAYPPGGYMLTWRGWLISCGDKATSREAKRSKSRLWRSLRTSRTTPRLDFRCTTALPAA